VTPPRPTFGSLKAKPPASPAAPKPESRKAERPASRLDRLPPHSQENEQGVIGCVLLSPEASLNHIASVISTPEEFYDLRHRAIYETAAEMLANREAVDFLTLHQKLKDKGLLESVGGLEYLSRMEAQVPSAANLGYYLEDVQEKFLLRRMIQVCTDAVGRAYECAGDVAGALDQFEREALSLRSRKRKSGTIRQHVHEAIQALEDRFNRKGAMLGLPTGLADLDRYTDGLCPAELIVPAAFPGAGKTSLSMNMVEHVILVNKLPAAVFSQEMTARQLVTRALCSTARVNLKDIGSGNMAEADYPKLVSAAGKLAASDLHIVEDCDNIGQIVAEARRLKQAHDIRLIVVDYLQLVTGGAKGRDYNREQEISGVASALKRLAKELNIPVVAPSQLTDDGKLRESRAIGQHADLVLKMTSKATEGDDCSQGEPVDVFIEKNRNGPSHVTVKLTFLKKWTRFETAAKVSDADVPEAEAAPRYSE